MGGARKLVRRHCLLRHAAWICCASGVVAGAWPAILGAHTWGLYLVTPNSAGHPFGVGSGILPFVAAALEAAALTLSAAAFGYSGGLPKWRCILLEVVTVCVATACLGFLASAATFTAILGR